MKLTNLLLLTLIFSVTSLFSQSEVKGTVKDGDGIPLAGANIVVKGSTNGTTTDFDGNYTIEAPSDGTLVFSYIGFETKEKKIGGQTTINVTLSEGNQ
ncbi:MAG: carboxypeptidase-like regulatory domain-containing protein, partial [Cellulophaga baltica]